MTGAMVVVALALGVRSARVLCTATNAAVTVRARLPATRIMSPERRRTQSWPRLAAALDRADIAVTPPAALRLVLLGSFSAGAIGVLMGGVALGVVTALAVLVAAPMTLVALDGRRHRHADQGLPAVLDDVARALRSGASPAAALATASTGVGATAARREVDRVVADLRSGVALVPALERWVDRRPSHSVRLIVAALAIGTSTGGARSRAIEAVGTTLRERQALDREASALATQARSSAVVIALAPLAFAVLASMSDTRVSRFLLGRPLGLFCLGLGLVLDGVGGWWMHRIVHPPPVPSRSSEQAARSVAPDPTLRLRMSGERAP